MNGIKALSITLCYACVAVSVITVMVPQQRTRRVMSFVIGLFFISTLITAVFAHSEEWRLDVPDVDDIPIPTYSEEAYRDTVIQMSADRLTMALNDLLKNEGITPEDIRLTLKNSEENRISVVRAVIYISESDRDKIPKIKSIVYRNISKEPEIDVTGEEAQQMAE